MYSHNDARFLIAFLGNGWQVKVTEIKSALETMNDCQFTSSSNLKDVCHDKSRKEIN